MDPATTADTIKLLPFPKECPRCAAPWAAVCMVNRDLPPREAVVDINPTRRNPPQPPVVAVLSAIDQLTMLAPAPWVKYACGSTFHEEDHALFDVPEQEEQHRDCRQAELAKYRGG